MGLDIHLLIYCPLLQTIARSSQERGRVGMGQPPQLAQVAHFEEKRLGPVPYASGRVLSAHRSIA